MHPTAYENAQKFFNNYCRLDIGTKTVLDIGACDFNGSMKPIFAAASKYTGLDTGPGPNVDVVGDCHDLPFEDASYDIIVSSSCFEHDDMFWVSFKEMCRVVKPNGYLYICVPSAGPYHGYPGDCWRFYKDSWAALQKWAARCDYNMILKEHYIDLRGTWQDNIGIFIKS